jgi:hypothetical protein
MEGQPLDLSNVLVLVLTLGVPMAVAALVMLRSAVILVRMQLQEAHATEPRAMSLRRHVRELEAQLAER